MFKNDAKLELVAVSKKKAPRTNCGTKSRELLEKDPISKHR